jgi:hypothetical protein
MSKTTKPNRFPGSVCSHVTLPRHSIRYLPPRPPRLCTFKSAPIPNLPRFSKLHNPNLAAQHTIRSTNCLAPHAVHELPRRPHRRLQGGILLPPGVKERRRPPREEAPRPARRRPRRRRRTCSRKSFATPFPSRGRCLRPTPPCTRRPAGASLRARPPACLLTRSTRSAHSSRCRRPPSPPRGTSVALVLPWYPEFKVRGCGRLRFAG